MRSVVKANRNAKFPRILCTYFADSKLTLQARYVHLITGLSAVSENIKEILSMETSKKDLQAGALKNT